jgi:hypothetical protein
MLFEYGERYYRKRESRRHYLYQAVAMDRICRKHGIEPNSAIDIGCASGTLLKEIRLILPEIPLVGIDHGEIPRRRFVLAEDERSVFIDIDFDEIPPVVPEVLTDKFNIVNFMEVIEHLSPDPEKELEVVKFTANLVGGLLFFTGAPPGQRGYGHANLQTKEHWIEQYQNAGLTYDRRLSKDAVKIFNSIGAPYGKNLIVFKR